MLQETCVPNNTRPGGKNTAQLAISLFPSLSIVKIYTSPSNIAARRTALQYSMFRLQSPPISVNHALSVQSQHWTSRLTEHRTPPANAWAERLAISLRCSSKCSEELNNYCSVLYVKSNTNRIASQGVQSNIPTFSGESCNAVLYITLQNNTTARGWE